MIYFWPSSNQNAGFLCLFAAVCCCCVATYIVLPWREEGRIEVRKKKTKKIIARKTKLRRRKGHRSANAIAHISIEGRWVGCGCWFSQTCYDGFSTIIPAYYTSHACTCTCTHTYTCANTYTYAYRSSPIKLTNSHRYDPYTSRSASGSCPAWWRRGADAHDTCQHAHAHDTCTCMHAHVCMHASNRYANAMLVHACIRKVRK